jgi:hypothetical protein
MAVAAWKTLPVILPHPDDESFPMGGTGVPDRPDCADHAVHRGEEGPAVHPVPRGAGAGADGGADPGGDRGQHPGGTAAAHVAGDLRAGGVLPAGAVAAAVLAGDIGVPGQVFRYPGTDGVLERT